MSLAEDLFKVNLFIWYICNPYIVDTSLATSLSNSLLIDSSHRRNTKYICSRALLSSADIQLEHCLSAAKEQQQVNIIIYCAYLKIISSFYFSVIKRSIYRKGFQWNFMWQITRESKVKFDIFSTFFRVRKVPLTRHENFPFLLSNINAV